MTIDPFTPGALSSSTNASLFVKTRAQLDDLQRQLATGQKSTTYGGLGFDRRTALDFQSRISTIDGYLSNIDNANLRLSLMDQVTTSLAQVAQDGVASALPGGYTPGTNGLTNAQVQAQGSMQQMIDALNSSLGGRYLFSGRATDTQPVVDYNTMINGDATHAGLKQLISERQQADLGTGGLGRLNLTSTATSVSVAEEAAGLPFGIKIEGATSTGGNITATYNGTSPASMSFDVTTQPADGDTVSFDLKYPDGTTKSFSFVARTTPNPLSPEISFQIGTTTTATAANLTALVQSTLQTEAKTTLSAASAEVAANDFFSGSLSNPPVRVAGPPFDTATTTTPGTANNTVIWYQGDDTATDPRATAPVQVDSGHNIGTGAQANEQAFRSMFVQFGVLVAQSFPQSDTNSHDRYEAVAERVHDGLSFPPGTQSVQNIATELALANKSIKAAKDRNTSLKSLLQNSVDSVENASNEDVAASILSLQTRLQASYQTTSIISKLSLTNYL